MILVSDEYADFTNYNEEHNILQYWEDNSVKNCIDKGFIPFSEKEIVELGDIF